MYSDPCPGTRLSPLGGGLFYSCSFTNVNAAGREHMDLEVKTCVSEIYKLIYGGVLDAQFE